MNERAHRFSHPHDCPIVRATGLSGFCGKKLAQTLSCVLEIGLGKARTYSRIRYLFPQRDIYVFDIAIHWPKELIPPADKLFGDDVHDTVPAAREQLGRTVALAHADIGSFAPNRDRGLFSFLAEEL